MTPLASRMKHAIGPMSKSSTYSSRESSTSRRDSIRLACWASSSSRCTRARPEAPVALLVRASAHRRRSIPLRRCFRCAKTSRHSPARGRASAGELSSDGGLVILGAAELYAARLDRCAKCRCVALDAFEYRPPFGEGARDAGAGSGERRSSPWPRSKTTRLFDAHRQPKPTSFQNASLHGPTRSSAVERGAAPAPSEDGAGRELRARCIALRPAAVLVSMSKSAMHRAVDPVVDVLVGPDAKREPLPCRSWTSRSWAVTVSIASRDQLLEVRAVDVRLDVADRPADVGGNQVEHALRHRREAPDAQVARHDHDRDLRRCRAG